MTLSPAWRHIVTEPLLPVKHGEEITLTCPADLSLTGGNKAACNDGILVVSPDNAPWCYGKSLLGSSHSGIVTAVLRSILRIYDSFYKQCY